MLLVRRAFLAMAAAVAVGLSMSSSSSGPVLLVDATAVKAGAPEHLVARGGECVRLFHAQGDVGCRSRTTRDMAPLLAVDSDEALAAWLADATPPRALVLPERLVTAQLLASPAATSGRLAGLFVYPEAASTANVSFASTTPQGQGSVDAKLNPFAGAKHAWNPTGRGLRDVSVPLPIVLLQDPALGELFTARARVNAKAHTGATFTAFMNHYYGPPAMDSVQCLTFKNIYGRRHPKCDPIGGQSAWGVRGNREANETVLVMAGMDAYAFSQVLAPGANEAASGVVALLAAAKALQVLPDTEFAKRVVFATFQAEKFGFVGSRRFLQDLHRAKKAGKDFCQQRVSDSASPFSPEFCTSPVHSNLEFTTIDPAGITYAIAVDQVGLVPKKTGNFSLHVNPNAPTAAAQKLVQAITTVPAAKAKVGVAGVKALPPSPLLSFVNAAEYGDKALVGAVLAGYGETFEGEGIYGSRHDVVGNVDMDAVVTASQVLAESIYTLAAKSVSESSLKKIEVNKTLVKDMLECISTNWRCKLMEDHSRPWVSTMIKYLSLKANSWPMYKKPVTLYSGPLNDDRQPLIMTSANKKSFGYVTDFKGTWSDESNRMTLFPNAYEVFTRAFLASSLADSAATTAKTCQITQDCGDKGLECVHPGVCIKLRAYFHDAYSPGLNRTAAVNVYDVVDKTMPLWTEPSWASDVGSYVFPNPGDWIGWVSLAIGLVVSGLGFVASRWLLSSVHKMKLL